MRRMIRNRGKRRKESGQSLVEYAFTLPLFLALILTIFELGNIVYHYALMSTASREAARYGVGIGVVDGGSLRYYDCGGIVEQAEELMGYTMNESTNISITYDTGPGGTIKYTSCEDLAALNGSDNIDSGDRIVVEITTEIHPLQYFFGGTTLDLTASSGRSILKGIVLD